MKAAAVAAARPLGLLRARAMAWRWPKYAATAFAASSIWVLSALLFCLGAAALELLAPLLLVHCLVLS